VGVAASPARETSVCTTTQHCEETKKNALGLLFPPEGRARAQHAAKKTREHVQKKTTTTKRMRQGRADLTLEM
jgi:hypothetical protein